MFCCQFVGMGKILYSFGILSNPMVESLNSSRFVVGLVLTAVTIGLGVAAPIAGWAFDRFSIPVTGRCLSYDAPIAELSDRIRVASVATIGIQPECLDRVVPLGEAHLRKLVRE